MTQEAIHSAIAHLLSVLGPERDGAGLSPGDRAVLRRIDPADPVFPPALWRLLTANAVAGGVAALGSPREQAERAFASLIPVMLEAGFFASGLSIGRALADTGYAEQRFVLLLHARGLREVTAQARAAVRWCASKGVGVRFDDSGRERGFAGFILDAVLDRSGANSRAHAMARDYFALPKSEDAAETSDAN